MEYKQVQLTCNSTCKMFSKYTQVKLRILYSEIQKIYNNKVNIWKNLKFVLSKKLIQLKPLSKINQKQTIGKKYQNQE